MTGRLIRYGFVGLIYTFLLWFDYTVWSGLFGSSIQNLGAVLGFFFLCLVSIPATLVVVYVGLVIVLGS